MPGICVSQTLGNPVPRIQRSGEWRTLMRNPGWAGAALIAAALTVTACGTGSAGGAYGGGYGTPAGGSTTGGSTTGGSQAMPASPGPATALKTETTRVGQI